MIDLDKFICSMIWHSTSGGLIRKCLKDQGLEYKDGKLVRIQEKRTPVTIESPYGKETFYMTDEQKDLFESSCKKPDTIKFEPDIDNKMPLKESNHAISSYHPRKFHPQTQGVLRLDEGNQSIVVERLLIELVEYIRSGISGLEESKVLPFLDSLQKSLEEQEKQHWTHVLGFPVPEGMKFFQVP